ncbi:MAG: HD domain-containing protein [Candidatus Hydrogenedentes bacterium]|nr:HD domain-containing protein [Candidatus Hydrogenedentota bacterium]
MSATQATSPVRSASGAVFLPIQLESLRVDTVTDFELYVQPHAGDAPVLYRGNGLPFTDDVRGRLAENGIECLYILSAEEAAYLRYMESNLAAILTDDHIDKEAKSNILYGSAQNLVKEVMLDPRSGEAIQRSQELVENTVNYLFAEKDAFEHLLKVTSFDYYTYTHSVNVFVFSVSLAQRIGMNDVATLREFGDGTLLHDIGKSMLDPAIINCRGRLTEAQWALMKMHPVYGYEILKDNGKLTDRALDVVRHHHEKIRGGGYPDNLSGAGISSWTRICTICDIFDALTTQRSYKPAMNSFPALRLMKDEMAPDLDPDFFRIFVDMMGNPGGH